MARNSRRRHYRVAQKEAKQAVAVRNGLYLSKNNLAKYSIIAGIFIVLVFIKGLILGYLAGNK